MAFYSALKLQGWDQVIALSEKYINDCLLYQFTVSPNLANFSAADPALGMSMVGTISSPSIAIYAGDSADPQAPSSAVFFINFASGSFTYHDFTKDPDKQQIDLTKASIAFSVNFNMVQTDPGSMPADLRAKILDPSSYSIQQILIDFSAVALDAFRWDLCTFPSIDPKPGETANLKSLVTTCINDYMVSLQKDPTASILGYALKATPDSSAAKAMFQPTSISPQPLASPETAKSTSQSPGNSTTNAFLLKQMTSNRASPQPPQMIYSAPWFSAGIGGTFVLARSLVWNQFFLPNLDCIKQVALDTTNSLGYWLIQTDSPDINMINAKQTWTITDGACPAISSIPWTDTGTQATASWSNNYKIVIQGPQSWTSNETFTHIFTPTLSFTAAYGNNSAGQGQIVVLTKVNLVVEIDHLTTVSDMSHHTTVTTQQQTRTIDLTYNTTINLSAVDATGALQVTVLPANITTCTATFTDVKTYSLFFPVTQNPNTALEDGIKSSLQSRVTGATETKAIQDALNSCTQLILPCAGTFFMKLPCFNDEGDLQLGLSYKLGT